MVGNLITNTAITLGAGASLVRRALAEQAVTLSSNSITTPPAPAETSNPGQTATYTVTQKDVDNGFVKNSAASMGNPPSGAAITSDPATAQVPAVQNAALSVTKKFHDHLCWPDHSLHVCRRQHRECHPCRCDD